MVVRPKGEISDCRRAQVCDDSGSAIPTRRIEPALSQTLDVIRDSRAPRLLLGPVIQRQFGLRDEDVDADTLVVGVVVPD